jgi:hypothetical protein
MRIYAIERSRNWIVGAVIFGLGLAVSPTHAEITFESQRRDLTTFALVSIPGGEDFFCNDEALSLDPGTFAETIDCEVTEAGSYAFALAGQLSYIFPDHFVAEGSFNAHAEISEESDFAEGLGSSRFISEFSVDVSTGIRLTATLYAGGNGATNIVFRAKDGAIFVGRTIHGDATDEVDEWFDLEPGTYELTFVTSGYGQAVPDGSGNPASGSFSGSIEFPTADVAVPGSPIEGRLAPIAVPNPLHHGAMLLPAYGGREIDSEIAVLDLGGRLIRRFAGVGPDGVVWDARDENGRQVAAGVYLVRGSGGTTSRAVVLR